MQVKAPFRHSSWLRFYHAPPGGQCAPKAVEGFSVRPATWLDFLLSHFGPVAPLSLSRAVGRGDKYFVARTRFRIAAIGRICYTDTDEVSLQHGEAALISFFTAPEYRGRGLYVLLIREMTRYLRSRGNAAVYIWADRRNDASIRGIEKAGFVPVSIDAEP
jgi:GNAT superfamily N-acetyltransferase